MLISTTAITFADTETLIVSIRTTRGGAAFATGRLKLCRIPPS